jgi:hypothetical protein
MAKPGKHHRYRQLEIWAEGGFIHLVDERFPPGDPKCYRAIPIREFLLRLQALSSGLARWKKKQWTDERIELQEFIDAGIACCREAKSQGDIFDPKAVDQMIRERRKHMLHAGTPAADRATQDKEAIERALAPLAVVTDDAPTIDDVVAVDAKIEGAE